MNLSSLLDIKMRARMDLRDFRRGDDWNSSKWLNLIGSWNVKKMT